MRHLFMCTAICLLAGGLISPLLAQQTDAEKIYEFEDHLQSVYLNQNGVSYDSMEPRAKAIMLGYAMGRQLKMIKDDEDFMAMHAALDRIIKQRFEDLAWGMGNTTDERRSAWQELNQLYASALAGYVDEQIAEQYQLPAKVPIAFSKNTGNTGSADRDIVGRWQAEVPDTPFYRELYLTDNDTAAGFEVNASSRGFKVPSFSAYTIAGDTLTLLSESSGIRAELTRIDVNTWRGPVLLSDGSAYSVANNEPMVITLSRVYIGDHRQ